MRTRALLRLVLPSPPRGFDDDSVRGASGVRQTRLTPSTASRASCRISWTRSPFRRSRDPFRPTLDRPPRRVCGIYTGLSNTRWASYEENA